MDWNESRPEGELVWWCIPAPLVHLELRPEQENWHLLGRLSLDENEWAVVINRSFACFSKKHFEMSEMIFMEWLANVVPVDWPGRS